MINSYSLVVVNPGKNNKIINAVGLSVKCDYIDKLYFTHFRLLATLNKTNM